MDIRTALIFTAGILCCIGIILGVTGIAMVLNFIAFQKRLKGIESALNNINESLGGKKAPDPDVTTPESETKNRKDA